MQDRWATRMAGLLSILLTGLLWGFYLTLSSAESLAQKPAGAIPGRVLARQGTIYYVATTGDDKNPGTIGLPWQTIQKAANTLVAGDTVYVRADTYPEQFMPQNSGSAGYYITYAAYPGETATIDGSGIALPDDLAGLFHIAGKEYIRVSRLYIANAGPVGLSLHDCCPGPAAHPVRNVTVVNNTFYDNGWTEWGGGIAVDNPDIENAVVRNNIVSQNLYFQIVVAPAVPRENVAVDHNLVDGYRGTEGEIRGDDYVEGDPLFVDPSAADFHLQTGSPPIDSGSAVDAPAGDMDGRLRPQDGDKDGTAGYDIGAYELGAQAEYVLYLPLLARHQ